MGPPPLNRSGVLRVSVSSGTRRADLVLPGTVPLTELVPELARSVGLLDAATAHGGYRVLTADGRELTPETGLVVQGVPDGGLLTVSSRIHDVPVRIYDDVVEAMADAVQRHLKPWAPAYGRRTVLVAAALMLAVGAIALLLEHARLVSGATATVMAFALVTAAVVLSRAQHEHEAAVAVAWMGCAYAALAGLLLVLREGLAVMGLPVAAAGAGASIAGLLCVVALREGRPLVLPAVMVGTVLFAAGLVAWTVALDPAVVLTCALTVVVLAGSAFPLLALGATGATVDRLVLPADNTAEPAEVAEVDMARVGADARLAHQILVATTASAGLLLLMAAPLAVSLGLSGTILAVVSCLTVMLRTRHHRTAREVLVGLGSGMIGLVAIAASLLWMHVEWRSTVAVTLAATGAVLLAGTLVPGTPSLRRSRFGDLAESLCLLGLVPLTVVATGIYSAVRA